MSFEECEGLIKDELGKYRKEAMSAESERVEMNEWRALVEAEQEVARCRAELNRLSSRVESLRKAMSSRSAWDRSTALEFLRLFPEDVPELLDLLADLSLSPGWAQPAREAIRAASREIAPYRFVEIVARYLSDGEAEDYVMLANMLTHVEAWEALGALIKRALESGDLEIKEVAHDFTESYSGMLP
ncbi:hypothetical protein [Streptomyces sp. NPDC060333]|uniref:hypothetical protein n=1 Tax=Streptomyces sp. NPDC060333 TaxID=3347098 RepID=UPI0036536A86